MIASWEVDGPRTFTTSLHLVTIYLLHKCGLLLIPIAFACVALAWKLQWWKSLKRRGIIREFIASVKRPWARGPGRP